ncbi:MAG: hypothetical protein R3A43_05045 [Bacteroidia bacterium]
MSHHWFNTADYSPFVLWTFLIGCLLWAVVYGFVIRDIIVHKTVGIPIAAVCGNFAWEIYWGLSIFGHTDMGYLFQVAYFIWFFLDCFIVYSTFKYAAKQEPIASAQKYQRGLTALILAVWIVILYFFIPEYDDRIGAYTGWIVNVNMSLAFILQKVKQPSFGASKAVAIGKFLGTGLCTTVVYYNFYQNKTLVALCFIFAALDLIYIYMVFKGDKNLSLA